MAPSELRRRQQTPGHRLAVQKVTVAGCGLERVPQGVAQVEGGSLTGLALVLADNLRLDRDATHHELFPIIGRRLVEARGHNGQQIVITDPCGLDGLDHAGP